MGILDGQVAMVTGAASGIGHAIASRFAAEGARVLAVDIATPELEPPSADGAIIPFRADVGAPEQVDAAMARCRAEFGGLDLLANNAGIGTIARKIHEYSS